MQLTLLTRAYCHLCDEMYEVLEPLAQANGVTVVCIDVDAHPELEEAYGERVPVLLAGEPHTGLELSHYRLDRARFEAWVAQWRAVGPEVASEAKIR